MSGTADLVNGNKINKLLINIIYSKESQLSIPSIRATAQVAKIRIKFDQTFVTLIIYLIEKNK